MPNRIKFWISFKSNPIIYNLMYRQNQMKLIQESTPVATLSWIIFQIMIWANLKFNSSLPPVQMGPPTKGLTVGKMYNMLTAKAYSIKVHNSLML